MGEKNIYRLILLLDEYSKEWKGIINKKRHVEQYTFLRRGNLIQVLHPTLLRTHRELLLDRSERGDGVLSLPRRGDLNRAGDHQRRHLNEANLQNGGFGGIHASFRLHAEYRLVEHCGTQLRNR